MEQITFKEDEKETSSPMGKGLINYSTTDKDRTHIGNKALEKNHIIIIVIVIIVIIVILEDECMLTLLKACLDAELQSFPYY